VLLVTSAFLGVKNAEYYNATLPLRIYGKGYYHERARGKIIKANQENTQSQNLGLMKSSMPLPRDDIAMSNIAPTFVRPADQATYLKGTDWVSFVSSKLVHPFSNSISGTILCQLRCLAKIKNDDHAKLTSQESMEKFLQLMISSRVFGSGGHTLFEFCFPLKLKEIQAEFASIPGFNQLGLREMFYKNNKAAFHKALEKTQQYFKIIQKREAVIEEIKSGHEKGNLVHNKLSAKREQSKYIETVTNTIEKMIQLLELEIYLNKLPQPALECVLLEKLKKAVNTFKHEDILTSKQIISEFMDELNKQEPGVQASHKSTQAFKILLKFDKELDHIIELPNKTTFADEEPKSKQPRR